MTHRAFSRTGLSAIVSEAALSNLPAEQQIAYMATLMRELLQAAAVEVALLEHGELVCSGVSGESAWTIGSTTKLDELSALAVGSQQGAVGMSLQTDIRLRPVAAAPTVRTLAVVPIFQAGKVAGVLRASFESADAVEDSEPLLQALASSLGAVLERGRMADALSRSEQRYRLIFERNPQAMFVYDPSTLTILTANDSAVRAYGYTSKEFIGKSLTDLPAFHEERRNIAASIASISPLARTENLRRRHRRRDNSIMEVELSGNGIVFEGRLARLVSVVDVTERHHADQTIVNMARAEQMLSACSEALIRAEDEKSLVDDVCQIAVRIGGYRVAWVGLSQNDATQTVLPVATAGEGADVIKEFQFSWSTKRSTGLGSVGRAIRQQESTSIAEMCDGPAAGWEDVCRHFDVHEVISLPLQNGRERHAFGVLALYSEVPFSPGSQELERMEKLADNLAFGIITLRARAEQRKLQEAVVRVAAAVTGQASVRFFDDLVKHFAQAVDAQSCVVAQLQRGEPPSGRVIAEYLVDPATGPMESVVAGTPFEGLTRQEMVVISSGLSERFPARFGAYEAFAGVRLNAASGMAIGMLAVFFRYALTDTALVENTLRIFAARAASELERQQSDVQLRAQASLLDKARDAILVRDMDHRILFWNQSCERLYGYTAVEALGASVIDLLYQEDVTAFEAADAHLLADGEWAGEISQRCKNGRTVTVEGRWNLVRDELSGATSALCINTDVSARKDAERAEHRASFYDVITGLPNRRQFEEKLQSAMTQVLEADECGAVLFLNIDDFANINKTLGRANGDHLLRQVGARLSEELQSSGGTVARTGGDEFLALLPHVVKGSDHVRHEVAACAGSLSSTLTRPFQLGSYEVSISACVGVATFGHDRAASTEEVLRHADFALGQAKKQGSKSIVFYDPSLQRVLAERTALVADLALALTRNEIQLHYQPQVDRSGRIIGAEALIRWNNAKRGMVSPAEFIPLAEESGLILSIGDWVIGAACNLLRRWSAMKEMASLTIAVNVSIAQFQQANFLGQVSETLRTSGAEPRLLKLELTESVLARDMEGVVHKMQALRALGVGFSMDDFGTGYSSLSYLRRLPLQQLKIDQSFVRDLLINTNGAAIAKTIIALAHGMGLSVVAEGVETADQREWLFANDCDAFQGYLYSRPIPEDRFAALLSTALDG